MSRERAASVVRCGDCAHFLADEQTLGRQGTCYAMPPQMMAANHHGQVALVGVRPTVLADDGCGQFLPRPPAIAEA